MNKQPPLLGSLSRPMIMASSFQNTKTKKALLILGFVAMSSLGLLQQTHMLRSLSSSWKSSLVENSINAGIRRSRPTTLILGIFSETGKTHAARRDFIRNTFLNIGDTRICKLEEFIRQADESNLHERTCIVPYTFVIGAGGDNRPPEHNSDEFAPLTLDTDENGNIDKEGDCTYLNIKGYSDSTKATTYMKFAAKIAEDYHIDYVSKMDPSSSLSIYRLFQFMKDDLPVAPFNRRMYGGSAIVSSNRNSIYASKEFYFVSTDLARYVGIELKAEQRKELRYSSTSTPAEDLDMGSFIHSNPNPVKFVNLSGDDILQEHSDNVLEEASLVWGTELKMGKFYSSPLSFDFFCPIFLSGKGI